jgi:hypothetical protein
MANPVQFQPLNVGDSIPIVDAVASALCENDGGDWSSKDEIGRAHWRELAKVALEAASEHLAPRIEFDEEGILSMLAGQKGCLE